MRRSLQAVVVEFSSLFFLAWMVFAKPWTPLAFFDVRFNSGIFVISSSCVHANSLVTLRNRKEIWYHPSAGQNMKNQGTGENS